MSNIAWQNPVRLGFDPSAEDETRDCFADAIARTLWLLWRPSHIVGNDFAELCLSVARSIRKTQPKTADQLARCFPMIFGHDYWREGDVLPFCREALPYFAGEKEIGFTVETKP